MSCLVENNSFRLLNHLVGWDEASGCVENIVGLNESAGIRLKPLSEQLLQLDEQTISQYMYPARIANSCDPCQWYLVIACPPKSRLLIMHACDYLWHEPEPGALCSLRCAVAVASSPTRIAVSDPAQQAVLFYEHTGKRMLGKVPINKPGVITYSKWEEWLVVDDEQNQIYRWDTAGVFIGQFASSLPGKIDRIAVDEQCRVWIAQQQSNGLYTLWMATMTEQVFRQVSLAQLMQAFTSTDLSIVNDEGFCFKQSRNNQGGKCYSWYGRLLDKPLTAAAAQELYVRQGQILTLAVDSGIPRCQWHRVRIDGNLPPGTSVSVSVSSHELESPQPQGVSATGWESFKPGIPHPNDWHEGLNGSQDFLIQQPPGRYLFVRIRMSSDGMNTPVIQRIRLDFPRQSSMKHLPYIYRENPKAEEFSERFLSLFDAYLEDIDAIIERLPALLDVGGVPDSVLPWLGRFLDVAIDPAWEVDRQRRILQAIPQLYRRRGTTAGLRQTIKLLFDFDPVIQELPLERSWGAVGDTVLSGGTRLFGRSSWRFMLGRSGLGRAPIRSYGNPDRDPFTATAFRFRVLVPDYLDEKDMIRLSQLIENLKPAHTVVSVEQGHSGILSGTGFTVGIDTLVPPLKTSVLGVEGNIRLGRSSVLGPLNRGHAARLKVGQAAAVGINSVVE